MHSPINTPGWRSIGVVLDFLCSC